MSVTYDPITHLPSSDAKNAYDLLEDVCQVIREEPRRYDQEEWLIDAEEIADPDRRPACGTIGCRAGWITVLATGKDAFGHNTLRLASKILGETAGGDDCSFSEFGYSISWLSSGSAVLDIAKGTPEYAEAGVAGIREFMEKWKERLLATPVNREV